MHIYSDISYFVQLWLSQNVIVISREYVDVTSESLLQVRHIGPLSSMKN